MEDHLRKGIRYMNDIVTVKDLSKSYKGKKAIDGIGFEVHSGEILGFLGPNGAGKSTTINILSGILSPDSGSVQILGKNLQRNAKKIKAEIGVVPQDLAIYEEITAEQNVRFFAGLYHIRGARLEQSVKDALELVGLYDRRAEKPKTFSGGMKRRLNIACAIAHQPKLIIMDEPTVGIDPQSRNHILESIKALRQSGATVIYSTHYMEEVEAICDRIIILNEGKIIAQGTKEDLNRQVDDEITYSFNVDGDIKDKNRLSQVAGVHKVVKSDDEVAVTVDKSKDNLNEIVTVLLEDGCKMRNMSSREASLEDVFLKLTGKALKD